MKTLVNWQGIRAHLDKNKMTLNWVNTIFLFSLHALFGVGILCYVLHFGPFRGPFHWGPWGVGIILYWMAGLGITMGYHRLWSHKTFKAHWTVEIILSLLGAMAMQNSAIKWSADHRKHHAYTDSDKDPYSASMGILWSHFLWVLFDTPRAIVSPPSLKQEFPNVLDLIQNPILRWQHRVYFIVGPVLSFLIPIGIGLLVHDFWNYLLIAGIGRILFTYHSTFFINSLAHFWGDRPHSKKNTSRDSFLCAILALGEGYHNFHHTYPNDYRNGYRYYHFDPTKWVIKGLSWPGLTWDLKTTKLA